MKKVTITLCSFAVAMILIGISTSFILSSKEVWSNRSSADSTALTPYSDKTSEINVSTPGSIIQVNINSNSTLTVELSRGTRLELRWVGTEFKRNVQIANVGVWSVRILNNNSADSSEYDAVINLKEPHYEKETPYLWLQTPLLLSGGLTLVVTGTAYLLSKTPKRISKQTWITILVAIFLILFIFSYQIGELLLRTSNPWMVCEGTSMEPAINYGDLAIVTGTNPKELVPDDIILFQQINLTPDSSEISSLSIPVAHRILSISIIQNQSFFQTKGDNNAQPDDWTVPQAGVIGKVFFVIPKIGYLLLILERIDVKILIISSLLILAFVWPAVKRQMKLKSKVKMQSCRKQAFSEL